MTELQRLIFSLAACVASFLFLPRVSASGSDASAARQRTPSITTDRVSRTISAEGETFVLRSSSRTEGVETEEYGIQGQNSENWTELITCQRLPLPETLNADEYVASLKQRLQNSDPTARIRVLQTHPRAAVFGIEYKAEDPRDGQLAFVLVTTVGAARTREIQLVQYTVRPGSMGFEQLRLRAKRWQTRFESQALLAQSEESSAISAHAQP